VGTASSQALAQAKSALDDLRGAVDLATGEDLFAVGRIIAESAPLRGILFDSSQPAEVRQASVDRVFGHHVGANALTIVRTVASSRWSTGAQALAAIEELGIRAIALSTPATVSLGAELFAVSKAVSSNAEFELTLGSKLVAPEAKIALVVRLLGAKAAEQTVAIVRQLVRHTRGRRFVTLLQHAASIVADQAGALVATARVAKPLSNDQVARLEKALSHSYGRAVAANVVVDPTAIGGVQVRVGDDVIDGSIASRFSDLRLQMA
jgi:F-type H+-transporting ATPase subunit delta